MGVKGATINILWAYKINQVKCSKDFIFYLEHKIFAIKYVNKTDTWAQNM